jgi:hypothetical protein
MQLAAPTAAAPIRVGRIANRANREAPNSPNRAESANPGAYCGRRRKDFTQPAAIAWVLACATRRALCATWSSGARRPDNSRRYAGETPPGVVGNQRRSLVVICKEVKAAACLPKASLAPIAREARTCAGRRASCAKRGSDGARAAAGMPRAARLHWNAIIRLGCNRD